MAPPSPARVQPFGVTGLGLYASMAEAAAKEAIKEEYFLTMDRARLESYAEKYAMYAGEEGDKALARMKNEMSALTEEIVRTVASREAYQYAKAELEKRDQEDEDDDSEEDDESDAGEEEEIDDDGEESSETQSDTPTKKPTKKVIDDENKALLPAKDENAEEQPKTEGTKEQKDQQEEATEIEKKEEQDKEEARQPWEKPTSARQKAKAEKDKVLEEFTATESMIFAAPASDAKRDAIWEKLKGNTLLATADKDAAKVKTFESSGPLTFNFSVKKKTLIATFHLHLETAEDVKLAKKFIESKEADSYLTQPPLPINLHLTFANYVLVQGELNPCHASKIVEIALVLKNIVDTRFPESSKSLKWTDDMFKVENDEDKEVREDFVDHFIKKPTFTRSAALMEEAAKTAKAEAEKKAKEETAAAQAAKYGKAETKGGSKKKSKKSKGKKKAKGDAAPAVAVSEETTLGEESKAGDDTAAKDEQKPMEAPVSWLGWVTRGILG